jgi:hypothetical protein
VVADLSERRTAWRQNVRFVALVERKGGELKCVIEDISLTGLRFVDRFGCRAGETVRMKIGDDWVLAKIIWVRDGSAGVRFA